MIDLTQFKTKRDLFKYLADNKDHLIAEKKFEMKRADAFFCLPSSLHDKDGAVKANTDAQYLLSKDSLEAKLVINTTRLLDSHNDVHIDGLWKKSIREQKGFYHLQEHQMKFDSVISDDAKAAVKTMPWSDLGFDMAGDTEALIFTSKIEKSRNEFMFGQYARGYVKNHSVGMRYVQLFLCINSDDEYYKNEKANWDKYIDFVANRKDAEDLGYLWAVTEAKIIEGSAVIMGSNWATPTQSVKSLEPPEDTQNDHTEPAPPLKSSMFEKLANL